MASGIVIWSKKPTSQKQVLLSMVEAAYDSRLQFNLHGYEEYSHAKIKNVKPYSFTIMKEIKENTPMIFDISTFEEQSSGIEKWTDVNLKRKRKKVIKEELFRLAVSENIDNEMTFFFSYYYLSKNKRHIITMSDFIIDWKLIEKAFQKGFSENWY